MKNIIKIPLTQEYINLSHELYDQMQRFSDLVNPGFNDVTDDEETCRLYDLFILLKLGYLKMYHCECTENTNLVLEVKI
jgi:hypothetical protein